MFEEILTGKENKVKEKINGYDMISYNEKEIKYYIYEEEYDTLTQPMTPLEQEQVNIVFETLDNIAKIFFEIDCKTKTILNIRYKENFGYYKTFPTNEDAHVTYFRLEYYGEDFGTAIKLILNEFINLLAATGARENDKNARKEFYKKVNKYFTKKKIYEVDELGAIFGFAPAHIKYYKVKLLIEYYKKYYNNLPPEVLEYLNKCMNFYIMKPKNYEWKYEDEKGLVLRKQK